MGRRKIEIKAIKDDRNRSVPQHGGPNEHKGPSDFNGGNDDEEEEEGDGTPPHAPEAVENQMMPPHFHGQPQPPFPQIRHHTPSASPPIGNGGPFQAHPGHPIQRGHTPQPPIGSRPGSRNDVRAMGPAMVSQPPPPAGPPHPGISYMPTPPIYNPPHPSGLMPQQGPQPQYAYHHQQPGPMQHSPYLGERRSPMPSPMPPAFTSQPPSQGIQAPARPTPSPQPNHQQLPPNPIPQISPPPPQPQQVERRLQDPPPPPPVEPKTELQERPQPPLLNTDTAIKKLPQRKSHSIFTPIEENRSILSQHLASFASEPLKSESAAAAAAANAANAANRSQSVDVAALHRAVDAAKSPHLPQRAHTQADEKTRTVSLSSIPETTLTPPSRSNSVKVGGGPGGARPRGPRLTVQIPDGGSEGGTPTGEVQSPRNPAETTTQAPQRHNSQSSLVLPPPSPSASALLSAGATGPPNPFARPPPQQNVNGETPVSALPSRFLGNDFLPSPSSFYPEWGFRGGDSNTLPSPLNFATPVVGSGPSFLRDDNMNTTSNANGTSSSSLNVTSSSMATKRKTPELGATAQSEGAEESTEPKRLKVE
ncbi:hypothetical protein ACJZ2D_008430 [Fusarium nematophilum]